MRVFMTGATGYIGNAVAKTLLTGGHEVTVLARSPEKASALGKLGARVIQGGLDSLDDLRSQVVSNEVFIHIAQSGSETADLDEKAIHVFTSNHDNRHFIYTSGVWVLGSTGSAVANEAAPANPIELVRWRASHERYVLGEMRDNFTTTVLRPGCVYGGRQSLLANWFEAAEKNEPLRIVGSGDQRWAMVHLDDLAECYRLIVERRVGGTLHAVDETRSKLRECAEAVIREGGSSSKIETIPLEEARKSMGGFADALAIDQQVGSGSTQYRLGWKPKHTFIESVPQQWREWREREKSG